MAINNKITCDEICVLLNRNIDGDLTKEEIGILYHHLAKCESCRQQMAEMAELELNLDQLNLVYESQTLNEKFNYKVKKAILDVEPESHPDLKNIRITRELVIKNYTLLVMGVCVIPAPVIDFAATAGLQLKMLSKLSGLYGVKFSENRAKSIIASLIGSIAPLGLAKGIFGGLVKAIPGIGHLLSAVTLPVTAGALTYAIGKVFIQHFESGGTFLDFDPKKVRKYFLEEFEKGQKVSSFAGAS